MIWQTLSKATVCRRCRLEQPAGAHMAVFVVGPLTFTRCADCEREVSARAAEIEQRRQAHVRTIPASATEDEAQRAQSAQFGGAGSLLPLSDITPPIKGRVVPFSALTDDVKAAQQRAAGDE